MKTAIRSLKEIYSLLPEGVEIVRSCSTGYGEALMKAAFLLDDGEVETVAHYYAAAFFDPSVDCILDIGGQDMKCIKIKNQTVEDVHKRQKLIRILQLAIDIIYRSHAAGDQIHLVKQISISIMLRI